MGSLINFFLPKSPFLRSCNFGYIHPMIKLAGYLINKSYSNSIWTNIINLGSIKYSLEAPIMTSHLSTISSFNDVIMSNSLFNEITSNVNMGYIRQCPYKLWRPITLEPITYLIVSIHHTVRLIELNKNNYAAWLAKHRFKSYAPPKFRCIYVR